MLDDGCDIRTIRVLLGHTSLRTTMIYRHVAGKNLIGVNSPIDKMSVDYRYIENIKELAISQISMDSQHLHGDFQNQFIQAKTSLIIIWI